jgi:PAS domain S-box-containing protein
MQGQGLGAVQRALRDPADPHPEGIRPFRDIFFKVSGPELQYLLDTRRFRLRIRLLGVCDIGVCNIDDETPFAKIARSIAVAIGVPLRRECTHQQAECCVIRILIVDDHEVVRRGVRSLLSLEKDIEVCGEAVDGQDAIAKAQELLPDFITMDISMPNMNGLEATREIRRIMPDVHILVLSQHDVPEMMQQALNAGANGYVVKSAVSTALVAALEIVRSGQHAFVPAVYGGTQTNVDTQEILQRSAAFEKALRESEQELKEKARLLDLSTDAILVRDSADRVTFWSQGAVEMYGYSREEALGRVTHHLFDTKFPEPIEGIHEKFLRDQRWAGELLHTRRDGAKIMVSSRWSLDRDTQGNIASILETNRDITEQKQAEQAQYRLAAIVESSDDAIVSKSLNGIITSWNAGAERIFGYTPDEAIGRSITIIIPPELQDEEREILRRLRSGERVEHFETIRQTKHGMRRHVSLTISPVRDARGRIIGASKIARDITDRKQIELVLKEAELSGRLLQLQDEERRRVARELHDGVGQLLAALGMNVAAIAQEKAKLSAAAARCVDENGALVEQALTEIRTLSHLLHPPFLDEVGLVSALEEYVDGFGKRSNLCVTLDLPAKMRRLPREYEICLFRIVQECLTNIHRHSGSATAQVRLSRIPGEIHLEVADQGRGIDPETQIKFFAGKGAGVGLQGMRERVRKLGGALQIQSDGNGTSVLVVLPVRDQAVEETDGETLALRDTSV